MKQQPNSATKGTQQQARTAKDISQPPQSEGTVEQILSHKFECGADTDAYLVHEAYAGGVPAKTEDRTGR